MTVRREKRRDAPTGTVREFWFVDVDFEHSDGRRERVRKVSPVQTRRGAEQYEREVRQALLEGKHRAQPPAAEPRRTFAEFSVEFLESYAVTNNKPSEVGTKRAAFRSHILPAFGPLPLKDIGPREVEAFKARKMQEGLSPKTINNLLTMVRRTLAVAVEWGQLDHVPPVKWMAVPEQPFRFLSFDEAKRLVAAADAEWRAMIIVALRTGMRQGELLALRWDDVDLEAGRLVVRRSVARGIVGTPKNGRSREIPLSEDALAGLRALSRGSALVFPGDADSLLAKGQCKWPLWRACARAGIQRIGWHALRHSFASHLVMRGVPMKAVQELLGHCTMEMTMRYAHLSADVRRDAVRLLDIKERVERGYQRASAVHVLAARERVVSAYRLASGGISARIAA